MIDPFRQLASFLVRAERFLDRIEPLLPPASPVPDWTAASAFRWRTGRGAAYLQPITRLPTIRLVDLCNIDPQKARIDANTRQFVAGQPANNVLLTGTRGCGKSSLIKALLNEYASQGLRVIEVEKGDLTDLPDIVELIDGRSERFIVFCDDLSFDSGDARYKALKVVLDGSIAAPYRNSAGELERLTPVQAGAAAEFVFEACADRMLPVFIEAASGEGLPDLCEQDLLSYRSKVRNTLVKAEIRKPETH